MRKTIIARTSASLVAAAALTTGALVTAPSAQAASSCTAVFLSPHQDDDVLSMGAAIQAHVAARGADKVCVALMTTGRNSGARSYFAGKGYIAYGQTTPYTNTTIANDPVAFGQARDLEFKTAVNRLGVPMSNIYLDNLPGYSRVFDYNTTAYETQQRAAANAFVNAAIAYWGRVDYKTQSHNDPSVDHRVLGRALKARVSSTNSVRVYWPQYQGRTQTYNAKLYTELPTNAHTVWMAASKYMTFLPSTGLYGIGGISVPQAFGDRALLIKKWNGTAYATTPPLSTAAFKTSLMVTKKSLNDMNP